MELLIIKTGSDYIRIKEAAYTTVGLDKASVFPMERLLRVKDHLARIQNSGFPQAVIYRLTLRETPL